MLNNNSFKSIDLTAVGAVSKLDALLHADQNFKKLSIQDIFTASSEQKNVAYILVGLWAFDFLKSPVFINGQLQAYNNKYLSSNEVQEVIEGLLSVIRYSHVEIFEDLDAIEYHYAACGKLYRLIGDKAETELVNQLVQTPTISFINALGVLVGHEVKGSITKETFLLLNNIAETGPEKFAKAARNVLLEDVARVNAINHFL